MEKKKRVLTESAQLLFTCQLLKSTLHSNWNLEVFTFFIVEEQREGESQEPTMREKEG